MTTGSVDTLRLAPWLVPAALLIAWLLFIASRQVPLFPLGPVAPTELVPLPLALLVVAVAAAVRVGRPSLATHLGLLIALTFGFSLVAAQLGQPFANATADECGDFCRTAIFGRLVSFFGWPIVAAAGLWGLTRWQRRWEPRSQHLVDWTVRWAVVTVPVGIAGAVLWWRIVLPDG